MELQQAIETCSMAIASLSHEHSARRVKQLTPSSAQRADIPVIGGSRSRFRLTHGNSCCRSVFFKNQSEEGSGKSNERLHER
jgi:hypothetical protein